MTAKDVVTVLPLVSETLKSTRPTPSAFAAGITVTVRFEPDPPSGALASSFPLAGSTDAFTVSVDTGADGSPMVNGTTTGVLRNVLVFAGVEMVGGKIWGTTVTLNVLCAWSPSSSVAVTSTVAVPGVLPA